MTRQPISFIATDRPQAALTFYGDTLGLTLTEASAYALVFRDGSTTLRVQIVENLSPAAFTAHGWQVRDIASEITALAASGVTFERFAHLDQSPLGVWTTPDGHQIAWFKDPSGNILSLTELAVTEDV